MKLNIDFFDGYALADSAARVFAEERTTKFPGEDYARSRRFLRESPVHALRFLWKNGDVSLRTTVACRVAVWMGRPVKEIGDRITAREKARLG